MLRRLTRKTEGRRGSQLRLDEGGRYLGITAKGGLATTREHADDLRRVSLGVQEIGCGTQLVSRRYERGALIVTSNQSLGAWGEVLGDSVIAATILDRLLHPSITANIKGESLPAAREAQGRAAQAQARRRPR
jgi:IstB-like ATP binding protein